MFSQSPLLNNASIRMCIHVPESYLPYCLPRFLQNLLQAPGVLCRVAFKHCLRILRRNEERVQNLTKAFLSSFLQLRKHFLSNAFLLDASTMLVKNKQQIKRNTNVDFVAITIKHKMTNVKTEKITNVTCVAFCANFKQRNVQEYVIYAITLH